MPAITPAAGAELAAAAKAVVDVAAKPAVAGAAVDAAVVAARTPGLAAMTSRIVGVSGLITGVGLTAWNALKDSGAGTDGLKSTNLVFSPATMLLGTGMGLLLLAEGGKLSNPYLLNGIRGGALAAILGGVAGAIIGTTMTLHNPNDRATRDNSLVQGSERVDGAIEPRTIGELEGVEIASADVITTRANPTSGAAPSDGGVKHVPVYLDVASATKLTAPTIAEAAAQARAIVQADDLDRSVAIVRTTDGAATPKFTYWATRLSGDLDQVDGRFYTKDNDYDRRYSPTLTKRNVGIQAIVGVESRYVFPEGLDPAGSRQQVGNTPVIPPVLPTVPTPSTTPATTPAGSGS